MNRSRCISIIAVLGCCWCGAATAQPVSPSVLPDMTLGGENSIVITTDGVGLISGGAARGKNLFHSFEQFSILPGQATYFENPINIEQIFSRVTGNLASEIEGTLGVQGNADLFLLNPNGILFGPDAQLDISGSFVGTTATNFDFGNDLSFGTVEPNSAPLLNVNVIPGLQFGTQANGAITNRGHLAVGKDLRLEANLLNLQGHLQSGSDLTLRAVDSLLVRDTVAEPFLAMAGRKLLVQGDRSVDIFALNHPQSGLYSGGDMVLRSANPVGGDAHYWAGGNFRIESGDNTLGQLYSPRDPVILASGDVSFFGYEGTSLHILAGGGVDIAAILITQTETQDRAINEVTTPQLANIVLSDGGSLIINGNRQPTVDIRAGVDMSVVQQSPRIIGEQSGLFFNDSLSQSISPGVDELATNSDISIGDIAILSGGLVYLTNQFIPNLEIRAGDIELTGLGPFDVGIDARGINGDASTVILDSRQNITVNGGSQNSFSGIDTSSTSNNIGNAGLIKLLASETLTLEKGAFLSSDVFNNSVGNGGDITLRAKNIELDEQSRLISRMIGIGDAGDINIDATEAISLANSSIVGSALITNAKGDSGSIQLQADSLSIRDASAIVSNTGGRGNAGDIEINVIDSINISDAIGLAASGVQSIVGFGAEGNGGKIDITARSLSLAGGAQLLAANDGLGIPGAINLSTELDVIVRGSGGLDNQGRELPSAIFIDIGREGQFPILNSLQKEDSAINIRSRNLRLLDGGQLVSSTFGKADAGDINIDVQEVAEFNGVGKNQLTSSAFARVDFGAEGNGGDINISAKQLNVLNGAQLITDTRSIGDAGDIIISTQKEIRLSGVGNAISAGVLAEQSSGTSSRVSLGARGNGGNIFIQSKIVNIENGATINSSTSGVGNAGDTLIKAEKILISGQSLSGLRSSILTSVEEDGKGRGGQVEIFANVLSLVDKGEIIARTIANGGAGEVFIRNAKLVFLDDASISTEVKSGAIVSELTPPSTISLDTDVLRLQSSAITTEVERGAQVTSAGDVVINARLVELTDNSEIQSQAASQNGGNVKVEATEGLSLRQESQISTTAGTAQAGGNGGDILINTPFLIALPNENSDIIANAFSGTGGEITINAQGIFNFDVADGQSQIQLRQNTTNNISASSERGTSGIITLNTPDVDPSRGLAELPSNLVDPANTIARACAAQLADGVSSFVISGRGGLPVRPGGVIAADYPTGDIRNLDIRVTNLIGEEDIAALRMKDYQSEVLEASQWAISEIGEVKLLAGQNITRYLTC